MQMTHVRLDRRRGFSVCCCCDATCSARWRWSVVLRTLSSSISSISIGAVALVPLRLLIPLPLLGVAPARLCCASRSELVFGLLLLRFIAGDVDDDGSGVSDT